MTRYILLFFTLLLIDSNGYLTAQNCITCTSGVTTLNNGLLFCVPFDGSDQNDKTANAFPGTFVNIPTSVTDRKSTANGAYKFNGTSSYIQYGDILDSVFARNPQAQFTISLWAKTSNLSVTQGDNVIMAKSSGGASGPYQWYIVHENDGKVACLVSYALSSNTNYFELKSPSTIATNTWFNVVLVYDGTQASNLNRLRMYLNTTAGVYSRNAGSGGTTTNNTSQQMTIGGEYNPATGNPVNVYDGAVDDVRIYNRILSNAEINELYNGTPLPAPAIPDVGVCIGDSVQLTASGGVNYTWTPSTNLSATNIPNPICKPTANRTYSVIISNGICSTTVNANVKVNQNCCVLASSVSSLNSTQLYYLPINNEARDVSATPANASIFGPTAGLNLDRNNNKNSSYAFNDATNDKIVTTPVPKLSFSAPLSFTISTWASARSIRNSLSNIVTVYKNGGYQLMMTPKSAAADSGKVQFLDYDGATSTTKVLLTSDSALNLNKWYLISIVVNKDDSTNTLYINNRLSAQVKAVNSVQNTCGVVVGNHNLNAQGFDGFIDEVRIYGSALTQSQIQNLYNQGSSTILNSDTTICSGDSVQINTIGYSTSYSWSPTAGLSDPTIPNPVARPATTTTYILTSTNGGCAFKDTVKITVNVSNANAGIDSIICPGDSLRLIGSGGSSYTWSPNLGLSNANISNPYAKPDTTKYYTLTVTTATCVTVDSVLITVNKVYADAGTDRTICFGDTAHLVASGGTSYFWNNFGSLSNNTIANPIANPTATTTYTVTVTNGNCVNTDSVKVDVIKVTPDAGTGGQICPGDSIQLHASGGTSFAWISNPSILDTTTANPFVKPPSSQYFYVYPSIGNCKAIDSVFVLVKSTLVADAGRDTFICRGESMPLNATGGTTFLWNFPQYLNNPNINNPIATPDSTRDFIIFSTSGNCTAADTMTLTVNQLPIVDAGNDTFACINAPFQLLPTIINANNYTWSPASFLDNPNIAYPNATINTRTQFWIDVKNTTTGCSNKDSLWLDVSTPIAHFTLSETSGDVPFTVHTTNQSTTQPMTYMWTFRDSVDFFSVEKDPSYTFYNTGSYKIALQSTDQYGCSAYDTLSVIARDVVLLFIPNAFTPNGDHSNELFKPVYSSDLVKNIEGTIWNRWGQVVYTFTIPGGTWWDGKSAGVISPEGVYVYQFKFTNQNNISKIYKGTVTLLR